MRSALRRAVVCVLAATTCRSVEGAGAGGGAEPVAPGGDGAVGVSPASVEVSDDAQSVAPAKPGTEAPASTEYAPPHPPVVPGPEWGTVVRRETTPDDMIFVAGGRYFLHETTDPPYEERVVVDFELDRTEVTVAAYRRCVSAGACRPPVSTHDPESGRTRHDAACNYGIKGRRNHPVNCVDLSDAEAYCKWAGKRLPTQWEWQWEARGRDAGADFPWGDAASSCEVAVKCLIGGKGGPGKDATGCGRESTWPVGSKPRGASRDGALDMAGNVAEWTSSTNGDYQIIRGGAFSQVHPINLTSWQDIPMDPATRYEDIGIRCARDPGG